MFLPIGFLFRHGSFAGGTGVLAPTTLVSNRADIERRERAFRLAPVRFCIIARLLPILVAWLVIDLLVILLWQFNSSQPTQIFYRTVTYNAA
jgi:hypothetical protein